MRGHRIRGAALHPLSIPLLPQRCPTSSLRGLTRANVFPEDQKLGIVLKLDQTHLPSTVHLEWRSRGLHLDPVGQGDRSEGKGLTFLMVPKYSSPSVQRARTSWPSQSRGLGPGVGAGEAGSQSEEAPERLSRGGCAIASWGGLARGVGRRS